MLLCFRLGFRSGEKLPKSTANASSHRALAVAPPGQASELETLSMCLAASWLRCAPPTAPRCNSVYAPLRIPWFAYLLDSMWFKYLLDSCFLDTFF